MSSDPNDLRLFVLQLAASNHNFDANEVVAAAEMYYKFLMETKPS